MIETPISDTAGLICLGDLQEEAATGSVSLEVMERPGVGRQMWEPSAYGWCPETHQHVLSTQTLLALSVQLPNRKLHVEMQITAGRKDRGTHSTADSLFTNSVSVNLAHLLKFICTPKITTCKAFAGTHKGLKTWELPDTHVPS